MICLIKNSSPDSCYQPLITTTKINCSWKQKAIVHVSKQEHQMIIHKMFLKMVFLMKFYWEPLSNYLIYIYREKEHERPQASSPTEYVSCLFSSNGSPLLKGRFRVHFLNHIHRSLYIYIVFETDANDMFLNVVIFVVRVWRGRSLLQGPNHVCELKQNMHASSPKT